MKILLLITSIVLIFSCQPRIKNDKKTLDKVFAMSEFSIEIQNWGCFGGINEHFSIRKKGNDYILKSIQTGKSHFVAQVNLDSLKTFLKTRIGKEVNGGCTSSEHIILSTLSNSVDYEHNYCDGLEATVINDLLGYKKLMDLR